MVTPAIGDVLAGGALIGLSASLLLMLSGRIAGISGIVGGLLSADHSRKEDDARWRIAFVLGLLAGGVLLYLFRPRSFDGAPSMNPLLVALAGLFVGVGTTLGNGCTSGHGVCGISRLSKRSIVGTCIFMATGVLTASVIRHLVGAS